MCLLSMIFLTFPISQGLLFLALSLNRSQISQSQDLILPTPWCTPYSWSSWGPSTEHKKAGDASASTVKPSLCALQLCAVFPGLGGRLEGQKDSIPQKSPLLNPLTRGNFLGAFSFCFPLWFQETRTAKPGDMKGKKIKTANSLFYDHSLSIDFLTLPTFSYLLFRILQELPYISCLGFLVGERYDTRCSLHRNQKRTL